MRWLRRWPGIVAFAKVSDQLKVEVSPAVQVMCARCGCHVYWLKRPQDGVTLTNLQPLENSSEPNDWDCPECGQEIFVNSQRGRKLKTSKGYMS